MSVHCELPIIDINAVRQKLDELVNSCIFISNLLAHEQTGSRFHYAHDGHTYQ